ALQIADRAADLGATLSSGAGTDTTGISTRSLTRNFPDALELLADVALHPSFPKDELERVRSERLTSIVQEKDEPFSLASRVLASALFGPRHSYGYPDSGTTESIQAISRDDLEKFWRQNYFPDDAALVVTGNINLGEAHGYTYGAGSFFRYHRSPGPFIVFSDVRTDVTAPATTEVFNELKRMRDTQMTPAELILSKDSIARSLPGRFERGTEAAATFAELFTYNLPLDY